MNIKTIATIIVSMVVSLNVNADVTVNINQKSCKYSVIIPEGWDSIPHDTMLSRFKGISVDIALYRKGSKGYYDDCYVLIDFLPTAKTLSQYPFKDIFTEVKNMNAQATLPHNDSLKVKYKGTEAKVVNDTYRIVTSSSVIKNKREAECMQTLLLAKFGYVSIAVYGKEKKISDMQALSDKIIAGIKLENKYEYREPESRNVFTLTNIVITFGIGLIVYIIIAFIDKKRKK